MTPEQALADASQAFADISQRGLSKSNWIYCRDGFIKSFEKNYGSIDPERITPDGSGGYFICMKDIPEKYPDW